MLTLYRFIIEFHIFSSNFTNILHMSLWTPYISKRRSVSHLYVTIYWVIPWQIIWKKIRITPSMFLFAQNLACKMVCGYKTRLWLCQWPAVNRSREIAKWIMTICHYTVLFIGQYHCTYLLKCSARDIVRCIKVQGFWLWEIKKNPTQRKRSFLRSFWMTFDLSEVDIPKILKKFPDDHLISIDCSELFHERVMSGCWEMKYASD